MLKKQGVPLQQPIGCTANMDQLMCVSFDVSFEVSADVEVTEVACLGPCEPPPPPQDCTLEVDLEIPDEDTEYTITFQPEDGVCTNGCCTTWCYEVTRVGDPAISHIVIPLCADIDETDIVSATFNGDPVPIEVDLDPTTCIYGIKFEFGRETSATICFTTSTARVARNALVGLFAGSFAFGLPGCQGGGAGITHLNSERICSPGCVVCGSDSRRQTRRR